MGRRVQRLRLVHGIGQVEFAQRLGIASGSVSKIENGRMAPTHEVIELMASVFDCKPSFLAGPERVGLTTRPWLRAYADASKKIVDQRAADCTTATEVVEILGLQAIPDTIPIFGGSLSDDDDIEQFSLDVRAAAGLSEDDVVGNCIRAAERLGCLVLPMPEELGRHLGLSVRANRTPVVCVTRTSGRNGIPGDRQRFTVAHELGHLGLHADLGPPATAAEATQFEKQAHRFAGAFLAPGDAILQELRPHGGRVTLRSLAALKETWGMSIKALVMRFQAMGVIDDDHARSLYKQISSRGWNKAEPIDVGGEEAIWMQKAVAKFARNAPGSYEIAAAQSGVGVSYFERWTDWSSHHAGDAVVLPFEHAQRGPESSVESRHDGSILPLPVRER